MSFPDSLYAILPPAATALYGLASFLLLISVPVALHEAGHLFAGRLTGIRAEVFSLGFGRTLVSRLDRHGTEWKICVLPLGGYVRFSDAMAKAPVAARALCVAAGPAANLVLAVAVFAGLAAWDGSPSDSSCISGVPETSALPLAAGDCILSVRSSLGTVEAPDFAAASAFLSLSPPGPVTLSVRTGQDGASGIRIWMKPSGARIDTVAPMFPAGRAGIRPGDRITHLDGSEVTTSLSMAGILAKTDLNEKIRIVWKRPDGLSKEAFLVPQTIRRPDPLTGDERLLPTLGVTMLSEILPQREGIGPVRAVTDGVAIAAALAARTGRAVYDMAFDSEASFALSGPVGIAAVTSDALDRGMRAFFLVTAFISLSLGLVNLLPVPALDGGHLAFLAWEAATGRRPGPVLERAMGIAGIAVVCWIGLLATWHDILRLLPLPQ